MRSAWLRPFVASLAALAAAASALTACAHRPAAPAPVASVKPGINDTFLSADLRADEWAARFEREGREIYDQRGALAGALGLRPGMEVADVGAGTGLFTALFAREVGPRGRVYAVDIATNFIAHIRRRSAEAGLSNVVPVLCTDRSVELAAHSIDRAFICDTYHHFEFPAQTMASLHRALRANGEIVVIDFHRVPGKSSDWTLNHVRAGQEVFTAEIEAAGFRKIDELPLLKENYVLRFRKVGR